MKNSRILKPVCAIMGLLATCSAAKADAGLPIIILYWPAAWLLLVPIILIEAVIGRWLLKARFWRCLCAAGLANIVSTFVGIPVVWMILCILQFWTPGSLGVAWLTPSAEGSWWIAPAVVILLTAFFYGASVLVEYYVARAFFPRELRSRVRSYEWKANLASYSFLAVFIICEVAANTHAWLQELSVLPVRAVVYLFTHKPY